MSRAEKITVLVFAVCFGCLYFYSNPAPQYFYDYTYRVAGALLHGRLGFTQQQPPWLNEMVPFKGEWYSVFPLGSVLSVVPFALLKVARVVGNFPARLLAAILAALTFTYAFLLTRVRRMDFWKRIVLAALPVVGTWAWTNLAFGGAWQFALGFAMLGEIAALYYVLVDESYWLAGFFFALAAGNRTEVFILAPLFLLLVFLKKKNAGSKFNLSLENLKPYLEFTCIPAVLLLLTFAYNFARFGSLTNFGYAMIPGVLLEPWYIHGIFSLSAIPLNFYTMLLQGWNYTSTPPYFIPSGFGGSILISSPWLFLLFRQAQEKSILVKISWVAVAVLTFVLWIHGDPGGWQFSYRYGMVLIPWLYLILILSGPEKITLNELALFAASFAANAYATYLYYWTGLVK